MKLTYEDKIKMYEESQNGKGPAELSRTFNIQTSGIKYLIRLIGIHGLDIVRPRKNKKYSKEFKLRLISKVLLEDQSVMSVSLEAGLSNMGILSNWISSYKKNGYNVIEKPKGRKSMTKPPVPKPEKQTTREEQLEQENLYLRAELEYLKKLQAVVHSKKKSLQKKK